MGPQKNSGTAWYHNIWIKHLGCSELVLSIPIDQLCLLAKVYELAEPNIVAWLWSVWLINYPTKKPYGNASVHPIHLSPPGYEPPPIFGWLVISHAHAYSGWTSVGEAC